jgi:hypothetical protein
LSCAVCLKVYNVSARLNVARAWGVPGWHRPESHNTSFFIGFHTLVVAVSLHLVGLRCCTEYNTSRLGLPWVLSRESARPVCQTPWPSGRCPVKTHSSRRVSLQLGATLRSLITIFPKMLSENLLILSSFVSQIVSDCVASWCRGIEE